MKANLNKAYALIIDNESCWGCKTCEVACKQENQTSSGVKLIYVTEDGPKMDDDNPELVFRVNVCRHCDDAPCVDACTEGIISNRKDGIVVLDSQRCTGCKLCIETCPHDAIAFDGVSDIARKCNLCYHRIEKGLMPACADNVCLAHCITFGNPNELARDILRGT